MKIALISCSVKKLSGTMRAEEKYKASTLFSKSLAYAKATTDKQMILSAKYGLLLLDDVISDYDQSLLDLSLHQRKEWASEVIEKLKENVDTFDEVFIYAGKTYYEFIVAELYEMFNHVTIQMEGMKVGERLSWLNKKIAQLPT